MSVYLHTLPAGDAVRPGIGAVGDEATIKTCRAVTRTRFVEHKLFFFLTGLTTLTNEHGKIPTRKTYCTLQEKTVHETQNSFDEKIRKTRWSTQCQDSLETSIDRKQQPIITQHSKLHSGVVTT